MSEKKYIFHIDVNSAFLSWSAVKRLKDDPTSQDLREIPSVVGGNQATRHGIVTAKSVPAKKFHIETGEPVAKALQKCPSLVLVSSDFSTYREYSRAFIAILYRYTDVVQQASIDEAYMDVTGLYDQYKTMVTEELPYPLCLAENIKNTIYRELGFTVNVGISNNKLLAKMASDFEKPDKIHTLFPEEVPSKMWPLPIRDLYGCGKRTAERLNRLGIKTIGDAAKMPLEVLQSHLGNKGGEYIHRSANGIGSDVLATEEREAKSYSNETTTPYDITRDNYGTEMPQKLQYLSEKVAGRMKRDTCYAGTISVIVKTSDFKKHSMQTKLSKSTNDEKVIFETATELMSALVFGESKMSGRPERGGEGLFSEPGMGIRLVGVRASGLDDGSYRQMTLFEVEENEKNREKEEKRGRLDQMMGDIRKRYGEEAIHRGM